MPLFLLTTFALVLLPDAWAAPPVAVAGRPFLAYPGDTVELNGSQSYDPDNDALDTWAWTQSGGPAVGVLSTGGPHPSFSPQEPGTYSFQLVVAAGGQTSQPDVVDVIVVAPDAGTRYREDAEKGCAAAPGGGLLGLLAGLLGALGRRRRRGA